MIHVIQMLRSKSSMWIKLLNHSLYATVLRVWRKHDGSSSVALGRKDFTILDAKPEYQIVQQT